MSEQVMSSPEPREAERDKEVERRFSEAANAAQKAEGMYERDAHYDDFGGRDATTITDNVGTKLEQRSGFSGGSRFNKVDASTIVDTEKGRTHYSTENFGQHGPRKRTGETDIIRYDSKGEETYRHSSKSPELAYRVGLLATKRVQEAAEERTSQNLS